MYQKNQMNLNFHLNLMFLRYLKYRSLLKSLRYQMNLPCLMYRSCLIYPKNR
jgi:hypothetical protein